MFDCIPENSPKSIVNCLAHIKIFKIKKKKTEHKIYHTNSLIPQILNTNKSTIPKYNVVTQNISKIIWKYKKIKIKIKRSWRSNGALIWESQQAAAESPDLAMGSSSEQGSLIGISSYPQSEREREREREREGEGSEFVISHKGSLLVAVVVGVDGWLKVRWVGGEGYGLCESRKKIYVSWGLKPF